jgi:hypothetical protein
MVMCAITSRTRHPAHSDGRVPLRHGGRVEQAGQGQELGGYGRLQVGVIGHDQLLATHTADIVTSSDEPPAPDSPVQGDAAVLRRRSDSWPAPDGAAHILPICAAAITEIT